MTIDWATIKSTVADEIGQAMSEVAAGDFAKYPIPGTPLAAIYTWDGSATVLASDTSEVSVSPASFIKLDVDGNWYKVASIDPDISITVEDLYSVGSYPSGATQTSKSSSGLPNPPSSGLFREKVGVPVADAVIDGVKDALDQAIINDVAEDVGNSVGPGVIV
jgi:hypothetical protein